MDTKAIQHALSTVESSELIHLWAKLSLHHPLPLYLLDPGCLINHVYRRSALETKISILRDGAKANAAVQVLVDSGIAKRVSFGKTDFIRLQDHHTVPLLQMKQKTELSGLSEDDFTAHMLRWMYTCVPPYGYEVFFAPLDWIAPHAEQLMLFCFTRLRDAASSPLSDSLKSEIESPSFIELGFVLTDRPAPESRPTFEISTTIRDVVRTEIKESLRSKKLAMAETAANQPPLVRFHLQLSQARTNGDVAQAFLQFYKEDPASAIPENEQKFHAGLILVQSTQEAWQHLMDFIFHPHGYFPDCPEWYRAGWAALIHTANHGFAAPLQLGAVLQSSEADLFKFPMLELYPASIKVLHTIREANTVEQVKSLMGMIIMVMRQSGALSRISFDTVLFQLLVAVRVLDLESCEDICAEMISVAEEQYGRHSLPFLEFQIAVASCLLRHKERSPLYRTWGHEASVTAFEVLNQNSLEFIHAASLILLLCDLEHENVQKMMCSVVELGVKLAQLENSLYSSTFAFVCRYWLQFRKDASMALLVADLIATASPKSLAGSVATLCKAGAEVYFDVCKGKETFTNELDRLQQLNLSEDFASIVAEGITVFMYLSSDCDALKADIPEIFLRGLEFCCEQLGRSEVEDINRIGVEILNQARLLLDMGQPELVQYILDRCEEVVETHKPRDLERWTSAVLARFSDLPSLVASKAQKKTKSKSSRKKRTKRSLNHNRTGTSASNSALILVGVAVAAVAVGVFGTVSILKKTK